MTLNASRDAFYADEQRMLDVWADAEEVFDLDLISWFAVSASRGRKVCLREEAIPLSVLVADVWCPREVAAFCSAGIFTSFVIRWNKAARTPRFFTSEAV